MAVFFEWDIEEVADGESSEYEDEEVIDHHHQCSFADCMSWLKGNEPPKGRKYLVVLVRDDDRGRSWAYLEDGKLPEWFEDAYQRDEARVPVRYHKEVAGGAAVTCNLCKG